MNVRVEEEDPNPTFEAIASTCSLWTTKSNLCYTFNYTPTRQIINKNVKYKIYKISNKHWVHLLFI